MVDSFTKRFNDKIAEADTSATKLEGATNLFYDMVHGPDDGYVTTDNGQVKTAAHAIKDLVAGFSASDYALKTLLNVDNTAMGNIGFGGFSKDNNTHIMLTSTNLSDVVKNSIWGFEDKPDSPFGNGKGTIHTMVLDSSNIMQIVYRIAPSTTPSASSTPYYIRIKSGSTFTSWVNSVSIDATTQANINTLSTINTKGDILIRGDTTTEKLAIGTEDQVLTVKSGVPAWGEAPTSGVNPYAAKRLAEENTGLYGETAVRLAYVTASGHILDHTPDTLTIATDSPIEYRYLSGGASLVNRIHLTRDGPAEPFEFILMQDNNCYALGYNNWGQLGIGSTVTPSAFTFVRSDIKAISLGVAHTLLLTTSNTIYACGAQYTGRNVLGDNTDTARSTPVLIGSKTNWKSIHAGVYTSYAIDDTNQLYGWGHTLAQTSPNVKIPTSILSNVSSISYSNGNISVQDDGTTTTLALKTDGKVYGWGKNENGQLGLGHSNTVNTPTEITALGTDNKTVLCLESNSCFVLKNDNSVVACGNNSNGILGQGNTTQLTSFTNMTNSLRSGRTITKISGGFQCTEYNNWTTFCILYDDNTLYITGGNTNINTLTPRQGIRGVKVKDFRLVLQDQSVPVLVILDDSNNVRYSVDANLQDLKYSPIIS